MVLVIKGDFDEYVNSTPVAINAGQTHTYPSDIDVKGATEITVQVTNGTMDGNGNVSGGLSISVDVLVYGAMTSSTGGFTNIPIGMMNLASNKSDMLFVNPGMYKIRLVITNSDTNNTTVNYKVVVKR